MTPDAPNPLVHSGLGAMDAPIAPSPYTPGGPFPSSVAIIPDHELLKRIGGGSYGEVWLARNVMGTLRAVKIVRRSDFSEAYPFEREFKGIQKYEPVSRSHDGLMDILQIGRNDEQGYFYYVMELADPVTSNPCSVISNQGLAMPRELNTDSLITDFSPRTLRSDLKRCGRLPPEECIRIALLLSSALDHLHQNGLVHRDIKPSNIIFVNGVPKLADIGLVADVDEARSFVGTVGFIAPEGPGSPQADVYSLGKVLYEMVTGKDRQEFPALPEEFQASNNVQLRELNQVILQACEGKPRLRYSSAHAMHNDLRRVTQGRPAKGVRSWRRPSKVIASLGLTVLVLIGTVVSLSLARTWKRGKTPSLKVANLVAQGEFLQQQLTDDSLKKAIIALNEAIRIDPACVPAYGALFRIYMWGVPGVSGQEKIQKVRDLAGKLMGLAPNRAESRLALSWSRYQEGDWVGAEREIQQALKLDSNYSRGHNLYSYYLSLLGRVEEAKDHARRAQELDPISRTVATIAGYPFMAARDYDGAIAQFRKALDLEPNFPLAHRWIAKALEAKGEYLAALDEYEQNAILSGEDKAKARARFRAISEAYTNWGPRGYWLKVLEFKAEAEASHQEGTVAQQGQWPLDGIYAQLGETNKALELLEKDFRGDASNSWLKLEPLYAPLRAESRFKALLKKAGLEK